jgi:branched-chain amino acid transport system ATP-binding protein
MTAATAEPRAGASGPETAEGLLEVSNLEVGYGDAGLSLRGISLSLPDGGAVAVLGANGAGKTTTIRAIAGMLRFHRGSVRAGEVRLRGERIDRLQPNRIVARGVAQIPEGRRLFANLTVEENLRTGGSQRRPAGREETLQQVYDLFPILAERRRSQAGWMSGGEQQMIAIGRALMADPRLLLIDELSLGLAPKITEEIVETLQRTRRELGLSLLVVEQNAQLALDMCDYAYIIESGRIVLEGPAQQLRDDPQVQAAYLAVGHGEAPSEVRAPQRKWWL